MRQKAFEKNRYTRIMDANAICIHYCRMSKILFSINQNVCSAILIKEIGEIICIRN